MPYDVWDYTKEGYFMEDDELLYQIGEAILTEVDGVEDVTYNRKKKNAFMILTEAGKFYELTLKEVE
ncbi:MAG: hypothetical protein ACLTE4_04895 [Christensenellaceae bacterium]|jgi:hypothetical protein